MAKKSEITLTAVESGKAALAALPDKAQAEEAALKGIVADLKAAMKKGYTADELAAVLEKAGLALKPYKIKQLVKSPRRNATQVK